MHHLVTVIRLAFRPGGRLISTPRQSKLPARQIGAGSLLALLALLAISTAGAAPASQVFASHGIKMLAPAGWMGVVAAADGPVVDPKTLLVVGTRGVTPRPSRCQIAAYRIPSGGAVVVVVGWTSLRNSGASHAKQGPLPLRKLVRVHRPSFECFNGRGAAADVVLHGKAYQVNVMIGLRATPNVVEHALAVGRSFNLSQ